MQMYVTFKEENNSKAGDVMTFLSHCMNAEIREGSIAGQKGWIFIFKDNLRPFSFGGKRKYTPEDENAIAQDIQSGKSLRKISQERKIATTTVHTLYKRYLNRHPGTNPYVRQPIVESRSIDQTVLKSSRNRE